MKKENVGDGRQEMGSEIPTANIQIPERPESGAEDRGRERGGVDLDGKGLLDELEGVMRRFVVLPKWGAEALALWVVHTYAFELREVSTYVGVESPEKRCGKTTLLGVLSELVNRPVVAANISSPAFFRVIEEERPTLLIDEADTWLQGNDQLRGILNSGYSRKTAYVVRVAREKCRVPGDEARRNSKLQNSNSRETSSTKPSPLTPLPIGLGEGNQTAQGSRLVRFSCWCPKAMAAIGRLPETLADRCIVIRMERKLAQEECERLRTLDGTTLRERCARWVGEHAAEIAGARPEIPKELNDRAADIWEPLLALADLAGGEWPERARQAAVGLTAKAQEHNPIASLLLDILYLFVTLKAERVFSRDLVDGLNTSTFKERPWREMVKGKEITEIWLSRQLRPYGVRPRTIWIGEESAKGYVKEDFQEVWPRYVPREEAKAFIAEKKGGKGGRRGARR